MSENSSLEELYADELKDLWSANDQMAKALKKIAPKATNAKLKKMLSGSQVGIAKHTDVLKALIKGLDEKVIKAHCKGIRPISVASPARLFSSRISCALTPHPAVWRQGWA
ncbi:DUF892 family protein [Variovorax sp. J22R24]|uniref:DUF892 family protein n=1 Tax=Variovorax gracilis TaxID=3053502 RepID=UPI002577D9E4|nr:DUF892 family protein [Variovorax sp. J22R24]MDM0109215.1 DUF892 family protein [Variovorax sp. J22R24]